MNGVLTTLTEQNDPKLIIKINNMQIKKTVSNSRPNNVVFNLEAQAI